MSANRRKSGEEAPESTNPAPDENSRSPSLTPNYPDSPSSTFEEAQSPYPLDIAAETESEAESDIEENVEVESDSDDEETPIDDEMIPLEKLSLAEGLKACKTILSGAITETRNAHYDPALKNNMLLFYKNVSAELPHYYSPGKDLLYRTAQFKEAIIPLLTFDETANMILSDHVLKRSFDSILSKIYKKLNAQVNQTFFEGFNPGKQAYLDLFAEIQKSLSQTLEDSPAFKTLTTCKNILHEQHDAWLTERQILSAETQFHLLTQGFQARNPSEKLDFVKAFQDFEVKPLLEVSNKTFNDTEDYDVAPIRELPSPIELIDRGQELISEDMKRSSAIRQHEPLRSSVQRCLDEQEIYLKQAMADTRQLRKTSLNEAATPEQIHAYKMKQEEVKGYLYPALDLNTLSIPMIAQLSALLQEVPERQRGTAIVKQIEDLLGTCQRVYETVAGLTQKATQGSNGVAEGDVVKAGFVTIFDKISDLMKSVEKVAGNANTLFQPAKQRSTFLTELVRWKGEAEEARNGLKENYEEYKGNFGFGLKNK